MPPRKPLVSERTLKALDVGPLLEEADRPEIELYRQVFLGRALETEKQNGDSGVWRFLELICSFPLVASDSEEPIQSLGWFGEMKFAGPDDLLQQEVEAARGWLPQVEDAELRARVGEIALLRGGRHHERVRLVAAAYVTSARTLPKETLWPVRADRLERALRLGLSLGRSHPAATNAHEAILEAMGGFRFGPTPWLPLRLSRLLFDLRLGDPPKESQRCRDIIESAQEARDERAIQDYSELLAKWEERSGNAEAVRGARLEVARSHERVGDQALESQPMVASAEYKAAIDTARAAGKQQDYAQDLQRKLTDAERRTLATLKRHSVSVDLTDTAERARDVVKGKSLVDALAALALECSPMPMQELRSGVEESAREFVFMHIAPQATLSGRGRTTAEIPSLHGTSEAKREVAMRMHMMQRAAMQQSMLATGLIEPARLQILLEHGPCISSGALAPLLDHNPMIPEGRIALFDRAIRAGLVGDWVVAAHLLPPLLEHSLRCILESQGAVVSSYDDQRIEREYDLGKLLDMPVTTSLLGPDLHFDLLGLLVRPAGSNIRNRIAHGLVPSEEFDSPYYRYLWCITLRMLVIPMLRRPHPSEVPEQPAPEAVDQADESGGKDAAAEETF
ncbi:MAG: DUF4209 domain-containing protein [Deltaproteobacteria bacterium]|nr:DUF4209 domain-containing protein [Deltaproteobacteria bacterium]